MLDLSSNSESDWLISQVSSEEKITVLQAKKSRTSRTDKQGTASREDIGAEKHSNAARTLRVYSSFSDNFQGSGRISQLLDAAEESLTDHTLRKVEFHAYYFPPNDLPVPSFCNLLHRSNQSLERLGIFHLRLDESHVLWFSQIVKSIGNLPFLRELTWDPIPASLWGNQLIETLSKLPALQNLQLTMDTDQFSTPYQNDFTFISDEKKPNLLPDLVQSLVSVRLSNSNLNAGFSRLLAMGVRQSYTLEYLDLSSSFFLEGQGCVELVNSLSQNRSLTHLDLTNVNFGRASLSCECNSAPSPKALIYHRLVEILEQHNTTLQVVEGVSGWESECDLDSTNKLDRLLTLNKSHIRNGHETIAPSAWPLFLHKVVSFSPTVGYQLLCQNVNSILSRAVHDNWEIRNCNIIDCSKIEEDMAIGEYTILGDPSHSFRFS
mmetsp:Transcript_5398/g.7055  ORF Transcript_5398/g.7055 Transcript_5398/m.7055 type:complete len:435 (+) Transcript_5398:141-1445(+)|eukprot:CAMPEP_0198146662 /NCGR_PEP_ID=MMETSP1443-20131203/30650_1 /TAXON_ID=186043 /ORGANISM="Entomoneis sp., Strain CCMP2396" /LENGTH=434 /DNA_ID=CAMNT_0043810703 /DNA_START=60 /DNA_END=1364 /DNA_ORIENTATION=+